jgi:hypothetical protein
MDTRQFKKILNESISTNGNSIFEIKGSLLARQTWQRAWYYALKKYEEYIIRQKQKQKETNVDGVKQDIAVTPELKKQIKAQFRKSLKDLGLSSENEERWKQVYQKFHNRNHNISMPSDGKEREASDAIWNILKLKSIKAKKSGMSQKEFGDKYGEFSETEAFKLVDKLDKFEREVEKSSKELTPENIITLILAVMMHREINKKDSNNLKRNHEFFGAFVETLLTNYFNQKGSSAGKLFNLLKEILSKSIWSANSMDFVKSLYDNKDFDLLFVLDDIIDKEPRGRKSSKNIALLKRAVNDFKDSESRLNESLEKQDIRKYLESFLPFAKERLGYDKDPEIDFVSDPENGKLTLGKTAYYEPKNMKVTIFIDNRHPKDVMRSLSHELVHHKQNCNGLFNNGNEMEEGYAQNNEHLRKMEEQAYLEGNMCFRDWEDGYKQSNPLSERRERIYYKLMRKLW